MRKTESIEELKNKTALALEQAVIVRSQIAELSERKYEKLNKFFYLKSYIGALEIVEEFCTDNDFGLALGAGTAGLAWLPIVAGGLIVDLVKAPFIAILNAKTKSEFCKEETLKIHNLKKELKEIKKTINKTAQKLTQI